MEIMRNWSDVPQELLGSIAERFTSIEDYFRFGAVCRTWRSVIVDLRRRHFKPKTLPWLMFTEFQEDEEGSHIKDEQGNSVVSHNFFSLSEEKTYNLNLPCDLCCCCMGSPYGWLIILHKQLEIINPLSHVRFLLPPLSTIKDYSRNSTTYWFHKKVLATLSSSSTPSPLRDQFVAFILFNQKVVFARPGNSAWVAIELPSTTNDDILHFNNQFYIIDKEGILRSFDITSPNPVGIDIALSPVHINDDCDSFYLVELLGELHMAVKYYSFDNVLLEDLKDENGHGEYYFRVFKFHLCTEKWEEVYSLGDYAFFVGSSTSFSLLASDYRGCKPSSIYFTDRLLCNMHSWGFCMGIYNLETDTSVIFCRDEKFSLYSCPVWIMPNLC